MPNDRQSTTGILIGNVGTLDIRNASRESIDSIERIGNVGWLLYSRESADALTRVTGVMGNLGFTIEASGDAQVHQGQTEFTGNYFSDRKSPLQLIALGRVVVGADVPAEEIENGLSDLWITGGLICPDHLLGAIRSKTRHLGGKTVTYRQGDRLAIGNLTMDENFLRAAEDDTSLAVVGNLNMSDVVPGDLLRQKLSRLSVTGKILMREENVQDVLQRLADDLHVTEIATIPTGYLLLNSDITLDSALLASLPSKKIYCARKVQIDPELDSAALDEGLESLYCEDMIICPAGLADAVRGKCANPTTRIVTYEGELWAIPAVTELAASRFEYLEGKAALLVTGVLEISPDIAPAVLADRLSVVHNTGVISCSPEQLGALQARLGISTGVLASSPVDSDAPKNRSSANAGYLAL